MSVNITNVLSLLQGEKMGTPNTWVNMASETQTGCHNYKIVGSSPCNGDLPTTTLFIEIPAFDPLKYPEKKKGYESGKGEEVISWMAIMPVLGFQLLLDETMANLFQRLKLHETVSFTRLHGAGAPATVDVASIDIPQPSLEDTVLRLEITLFFKDSMLVKKICCNSYYDGAPYNECDGEGETGDPNIDPVCEDLEVAIALAAGPTLTATPTGGPGAGIETFTWYLNGVYFGMGSVVVPTLPGVYRVDYAIGNCKASQQFTYNTPCTGFEVEVNTLVLGDGSTILIASPNLVADIQWQIFNDPNWEDIPGETENIFQPDVDGSYRAVATTEAECEAISAAVEVDLAIVCADLYLAEISIIDGVVTSVISDYEGEEVPTYTWYLDQGEGPVEQAWTGPTTPATLPGMYILHILLEGCLQVVQVLVNCEMAVPPCGDPCDLGGYQEFGPGITGNEFTITNFVLLDPAFYTADQINAVLQIEKNGVRLYYGQAGRTGYTIDYALQRIVLDPLWPLKTTEFLSATKLK